MKQENRKAKKDAEARLSRLYQQFFDSLTTIPEPDTLSESPTEQENE